MNQELKLPTEAVPKISAHWLGLFARYSRGYVARHFHSVRVSVRGTPPDLGDIPLVIYLNHASWWDPLICLLLQKEFFAQQRAFAPIDAAALTRYGFFAKLGFFGVEQDSSRGAARFLKTVAAVLRQPGNILWLTPQGGFADVRTRPVRFKPGLSHLPRLVEQAAFVPLALEYVFWEECKPEVLCRFGKPTVGGRGIAIFDRARDWQEHFELELAATQQKLAAEVQRRAPDEFHDLLRKHSGVGFIYDTYRLIKAKLRGREFRREHGTL